MNGDATGPGSGDRILVGDRLVELSGEMLRTLEEGGRLIPLRSTGTVLVVPAAIRRLVDAAVADAVEGFAALQGTASSRVDDFFTLFAELIEDDHAFAHVLAANAVDVESARQRGRATGRLEITTKMRTDMAAGLRMWAGLSFERLGIMSTIDHEGWSVESWRAPLGVVAFVFEGRPNVFADATGVLKSGNSVVFRIGSDALGTARAIRDHLLIPALDSAGLPRGAVNLVDSSEHAAGWALFHDSRLALAVARGSGRAVDQLGEIARQCGTPVARGWSRDRKFRLLACGLRSCTLSIERCATHSTRSSFSSPTHRRPFRSSVMRFLRWPPGEVARLSCTRLRRRLQP
jgi:glutamate-5-semialdehyde dehydrogenase